MTYKSYKIINKYKIQNCIKFELDGNVEFSGGKQNFIRCVDDYPFINYQIGDKIEVNLTITKNMSAYDYINQQEVVKKTNYYNYALQQDEKESSNERPNPLISAQESVTLSAYDKKVAQ